MLSLLSLSIIHCFRPRLAHRKMNKGRLPLSSTESYGQGCGGENSDWNFSCLRKPSWYRKVHFEPALAAPKGSSSIPLECMHWTYVLVESVGFHDSSAFLQMRSQFALLSITRMGGIRAHKVMRAHKVKPGGRTQNMCGGCTHVHWSHPKWLTLSSSAHVLLFFQHPYSSLCREPYRGHLWNTISPAQGKWCFPFSLMCSSWNSLTASPILPGNSYKSLLQR